MRTVDKAMKTDGITPHMLSEMTIRYITSPSFVIPTKGILDTEAKIRTWITIGACGGIIYGRPRIGKTRCIFHLAESLQSDECGNLPVVIWNITDHLKLQGTIGTDMNYMTFQDYIARTTPGKLAGQLMEQKFNNRTLNAELLALYNQSFGDFDVNATLGGNIFKVNNKTDVFTGMDQQMKDIVAIMNRPTI